MGDGTAISWTDATWNPVRGCSRVSEGCRHCYAERVAARFCGPGQPYEGLADRDRRGSKWTGVVRMVPEHLADPLRWRRPRRIFVNSMSDLFHEALTNEQIAAVFGVMAAAPQHTFQVLTKRAERMRDWFRWGESQCDVAASGGVYCINSLDEQEPDVLGDKLFLGVPWPLPNVWLGVSVENQAAADERVPLLLQTPAAVRFLSCEPLLGPVKIRGERDRCGDCDPCIGGAPCSVTSAYYEALHPDGIRWVIAGCESGSGARPCDVAWLRALRNQCAAAGVPFWLKQMTDVYGSGRFWSDDLTAGDVVPGPGSKRKPGGVIELPYLDGVQHAAFPR